MARPSYLIPPRVGRGEAGGAEAVEFAADSSQLGLEDFELLTHAEDDVDAGEVDAKLIDEALGVPDTGEVVVGVHSDVADGTAWLDEAGAFVIPKGLLMDADEAGSDGDDVTRLVVREDIAFSFGLGVA